MAVTWEIKVDTVALTPGDTFDVAALRLDARAGDRFEFAEHVAHYAATYTEGQDVEFLDGGTRRFLGTIEEIHKESRAGEDVILYRCAGPRTAARRVPIERGGPDETTPNTYPRRVYNAPDDDPDAVYNPIANTSTVGDIIEDLFTSFDTPLLAEGAIQTTGTGFDGLETALLTFVPGKMVFAGLKFESVIESVLIEQGPAWGIWVDYLTGVWHFYDTTAPGSTLTYSLNAEATHPVQDHENKSDVAQAETAVKIYGAIGAGEQIIPHQVGDGTDEAGETLAGVTEVWDGGKEATWTRKQASGKRHSGIVAAIPAGDTIRVTPTTTWSGGIWGGGQIYFPWYSYSVGFTVLTSTADTIQLVGSLPVEITVGMPFTVVEDGGGFADVFRRFQITDAAKRDIVVEGTGIGVECCPHVEAILRNSSGDTLGVDKVAIRILDDGTFITEEPLFISDSNGRNVGDSSVWADWRLVYCYRDSSAVSQLVARHPVAGFAGEASGAPWNVERERSLIVPEFEDIPDKGTYVALALELHKIASVVRQSGKLVLFGIDYTPTDLRALLRLSHTTETTGWEALDAPIVSAEYNYLEDRTEIGYGTDGSTADADYRPVLEQIQARRALALGDDAGGKTADYIRCQTSARTSRAFSSTLSPASNSGALSGTQIAEPVYHFPGIDCSVQCSCDLLTDPCDTDQSLASQRNQFICMPDGQHGLTIHHPGNPGTQYCTQSQLLRFDQYPPADLDTSQDGMYYPFTCKTIPIGDHPLNQNTGSCGAFGMRDLVVVEPFGPDDGDGGDDIGVGSFLLLWLESYDHYMQRVQDSLCCLDERFAKVDGDIWGGVNTACGVGAECTISSAIVALYLTTKRLGECCSNIRQGDGDRLNCDVQPFPCDWTQGGPC